MQGTHLDKRVDAVWKKLLKIMSDEDLIGHGNNLIEQGEQDLTLYQDYLSGGTTYKQNN